MCTPPGSSKTKTRWGAQVASGERAEKIAKEALGEWKGSQGQVGASDLLKTDVTRALCEWGRGNETSEVVGFEREQGGWRISGATKRWPWMTLALNALDQADGSQVETTAWKLKKKSQEPMPGSLGILGKVGVGSKQAPAWLTVEAMEDRSCWTESAAEEKLTGQQLGFQGPEKTEHRAGASEVSRAADDYARAVTQDESPKAWAEAIWTGVLLIEAAGSLTGALRELQSIWKERSGARLSTEGLREVAHLIDPGRQAYLATVAADGAPYRYEGVREGRVMDPHHSAVEDAAGVRSALWKDAKALRVLTTCWASGEALENVQCCPLGWVKKMNPDRTLSTEGRPVHDLREVNEDVDIETFQQVMLPQLKDILREALRVSMMWPKLKVLINKRDVKAAFKLIMNALEDCELTGTTLPLGDDIVKELRALVEGAGRKWDASWATLVSIYITLVFGFRGAPSEWQTAAMACEEVHGAVEPVNPRREGPEAFLSKWFVDDPVQVEPAAGGRHFEATRALEAAIRVLFGQEAVNAEKVELEGDWDTRKIVWGLWVDLKAGPPRMSPTGKAGG